MITRREEQKQVGKGKLVSSLFDAAFAGDEATKSIIERYVEGCGELRSAGGGARRIRRLDTFDLIYSGGLITSEIQTHYPNARPVYSRLELVIGAAYWGFEAAGILITLEPKNWLPISAVNMIKRKTPAFFLSNGEDMAAGKLKFDATGFFRTHHDRKRWWLVDPDDYAFISTGLDGALGYLAPRSARRVYGSLGAV